jgi:hypothetical protein
LNARAILDALPFRADKSINRSIQETARNLTAPQQTFFDANGYFATNSPGAIPGDDFFYEHVHFNFDGNYRLALGWATQVATLLNSPPKAASINWGSQKSVNSALP